MHKQSKDFFTCQELELLLLHHLTCCVFFFPGLVLLGGGYLSNIYVIVDHEPVTVIFREDLDLKAAAAE